MKKIDVNLLIKYFDPINQFLVYLGKLKENRVCAEVYSPNGYRLTSRLDTAASISIMI
jgi:hypothetical protein